MESILKNIHVIQMSSPLKQTSKPWKDQAIWGVFLLSLLLLHVYVYMQVCIENWHTLSLRMRDNEQKLICSYDKTMDGTNHCKLH